MRVCPRCSTATAESGWFCPDCGAAFADAPVEAAAGGAAPSREELAASLVGVQVDGFSIEGVIGAGSFATVYKARQNGLDRLVALKVPTHEIVSDPIMAKRFAREARNASRVHHPGIVTIYAVGALEDDRPYLAMELVEGQSLERILDEGPIEPVRALRIARQVASALSETHAANVVHRDLKPSNIVWRVDRIGDDRTTIVDFGIAVSKPGTADATRLTANGLIGTPHYMSPEQAHGEAVDARADLYALGCIVFELVTGETPFHGSGYEVLLAHLGRPAPAPSSVKPDVPTLVDDFVSRLLAKRKESRPPTADAVVADLDRILALLEGRPPPTVHAAFAPLPAAPTAAKPPSTGANMRVGSGPRSKLHGSSDTVNAIALADTSASSSLDVAAAASIATAAEVHARQARPDSAGESLALPPAPSRARWFALGLLVALAASAGAVGVLWRTQGRTLATTDDTPAVVEREEVLLESGEARLRIWVPHPLVAKRMARFRLELRNKLGALLHPDQLVVTVEEPGGRAIGLAARPRSADPDQYGFGHAFPKSGTYLLRIFPPETPTAFELPIDVQ